SVSGFRPIDGEGSEELGTIEPGRLGGDPGWVWPPPRRPGRGACGRFRDEGTGGPSRRSHVREGDVRFVSLPRACPSTGPATVVQLAPLWAAQLHNRDGACREVVTFATSLIRRGDVRDISLTPR